ncbi:MAG: acyl-CoA dehydrogenase family protein, partial [Deltaproteobacteria bacterium]|nr:acyl-CoA dehydrogenase family protein [Deltaproteobacteria bacterium]
MLPFFDQDHLALRERVRAWVEANLIGGSAGEENLEAEARRLVKQLGAAGFNRHAVLRAYGGAREKVEARDLCILREELACGSALAD